MGTEVCLPEQVKAVRAAGVDFVWIGARTVSNPFMVEAIAEQLEGATQTVLVKNPISPDAVSYTHLDVYKRQAPSRDASSALARGAHRQPVPAQERA